MKKILICLFVTILFLRGTATAQSKTQPIIEEQTKSPFDRIMKFDHKYIDFSLAKLNHPVTVTFTFTNISQNSIAVIKTRSSCSCITSSWSKKPILPGKKGHIKVTYNAAAVGKIYKSIDVEFKGFPKALKLYLTGTIKP